MGRIITYLLVLLVVATVLAGWIVAYGGDVLRANVLLASECIMIGMIAGILYCLRAVYVNTGLNRWDPNWTVWFYLRPVTSAISGFASFMFLQAGLLALSSKADVEAVPYGYLAIAFIAGYNVDSFLKKLEQVAHELWGIEKSRASQHGKTDVEGPIQEE